MAEVYGSDVQLLVLEPVYVLKTRDADSLEKVFINVCTCAKVRGGLLRSAVLPMHHRDA